MNHTTSLFSVEEIFLRLGESKASGWLHIYTIEHSAQVFLKDGLVKAASAGSLESEAALTQILQWHDVHTVWHGNRPLPEHPKSKINVPLINFVMTHSIKRDEKKNQSKLLLNRPEIHPIVYKASTLRLHEVLTSKTDRVPLSETSKKSSSSGEPVSLSNKLPPKLQFSLVLKNSELEREEVIPIIKSPCVLGRHFSCDLVINHSSISRHHCLVQIVEEGIKLRDLGSTNGTRINGTMAHDTLLKVGDPVVIGYIPARLQKTTTRKTSRMPHPLPWS